MTSDCGRVQKAYGYAARIVMHRHKAKVTEEPTPVYAVDPLNPTDAELAAAIQRGLDNGTLIDAADWMAQHAAELGKDTSLI